MDDYHARSRYSRDQRQEHFHSEAEPPPLYLKYSKESIALPQPREIGPVSLEEAIIKRRSVRSFSEQPITLESLSQLLWSAQGITRRLEKLDLRAAPSAGATYPMETYAIVNSVEDCPQGLYHYQVSGHSLEILKQEPLSGKLAAAALHQPFLAKAAVCFLWTAVFARVEHRYGKRALRYTYTEAGHIAQNLCLQAAALDLSSCVVGAFFDEEIEELLTVDEKYESIVYLAAVGNPAR